MVLMKKDLFLRTDVLPAEIPILLSNKSVYLNFSKKNLNSLKGAKKMLECVTVPYFFFIPKSKGEERKIGLVHPIAQLQMFNYILQYEKLITSFCKNSPYSVRSPIKRNIPKVEEQELRKKEIRKLEEEFSFTDKISVTSEEDKILFYNYFSYKKYTRIKDLYTSPKFNRDKYKYGCFMKLDIQRCFPSIYTHSLAWAIFGNKALAKNYMGKEFKNIFPNASDIISQRINFNETHGLIVGPEFSRVLAELLFTRIDMDLQIKLRDNGLINRKHYSVYRYIDDYFLFTRNHEDAKFIEKNLKEELNKYNLNLNIGKSQLQEKPFKINGSQILDLKMIIKQFSHDKKLTFDLKKEMNPSSELLFLNYKGSRNQWNILFERLEELVAEHPDSKAKIVNYFLKAIRASIKYDGSHNFVISNILEIISNTLILDINHNSTNYLIAIYIKILNRAKMIKNICYQKLKEEKTESSQNKYTESLNNLTFIEEKIFQHSLRILKNNINHIQYMYDLIIFMKLLDKNLSSSFLCKILDVHKESYFVCCAVAYYILDEDQKSLNLNFITVSKKIANTIDQKVNNYEAKGAKHKILESEYFYFLNDFSKYPGFRPSKRDKLSKRLKTEFTVFCGGSDTDIWELLTSYSYFEWGAEMDTFVRKIVKKSSNTKLNSKVDY